MESVFDLHNDILTEIKNNKKRKKILCCNKAKMAKNIVSAVWTSKMNNTSAVECIVESHDFICDYNKQSEQNKLHLAIEDLHFYSKSNLDKIINMSPVYCSLTWNYDNCLAGGALDGGGLTTLGIEVVKKLEQNNIYIDTAHLNEKSFMGFCSVTEKPILCSHTAVEAIKSNKRNLKDYQIKMVAESGGVIGVAFVADFLTESKRAEISDLARHIDYVVSKFGENILSLGTDFYGAKNTVKGVVGYSNLVLLENKLKFMGYSQETIDKIFYKNAENFFAK